MKLRPRLASFVSLFVVAACGSTGADETVHERGHHGELHGAGAAMRATTSAPSRSAIQHLVVVEQENHTFDAYFGRYCTGAPGVSCATGRECCEAAPAQVGQLGQVGACAPAVLDDARNGASDPPHEANREWEEMHLTGGVFAMDRFPCDTVAYAAAPDDSFASSAIADASYPLRTYHHYATVGALADRYFQPIIGASSSNDMFLARASFVFQDNQATPSSRTYVDPTIGDRLDAAGVTWQMTMGGLDDGDADLSDNPFAYFASTRGRERDFRHFANDLERGRLPAVTFVRGGERNMEHPGDGVRITDGEAFTRGIVDTVLASAYADDTLILVTWDEGGGFYDHVAPPLTMADGTPLPRTPLAGDDAGDRSTLEGGAIVPSGLDDPEYYSNADAMGGQEHYGTRVPLLALGRFARVNAVSHVPMEHSSIVRFIEWNWLGGATLGTRDAHVRNLGSLLDPTLGVPE